jgi:glycosyltransferase involved in cell wall biosynthesis
MSDSRAMLWYSNSPFSPTGYGVQTAMMLKLLPKDGYKVAVACNYGLEGPNSHWNNGSEMIPLYSRGNDVWSNDTITPHAWHWNNLNKDSKFLIVTLFDVWVFQKNMWGKYPVVSWTPVDHNPVPSPVSDWAKLDFVTTIAMTRYGQEQYKNLGIDAYYIPHGIEKVFQPTQYLTTMADEQISPRKFMKIDEDKFVIGINAANKGFPARKAWAENLLAYSIFCKDKDDVVLYLHTDIIGSGGTNLLDLIKSLNIPEEKIKWVDQYAYRSGLPQQVVAGIYTSIDVLLATSYGEGFGIPTLEAQRCETPVIVTDCAASPELVGEGWKVSGQLFWNPPMKAWYTIPNVGEIVDALNQAYKRGRKRSKKAKEFADQYDADLVYETMWKPTLDEIYSKI